MAHLGGLGTGLLAGLFFARTFSSPGPERFFRQLRILAATTLALLLALWPVKHAKAYVIEFREGDKAISRKDYDSAVVHLQKYVQLSPDDPLGHIELGLAFVLAHRSDDAISEYQRALALKPDMPEVELILANIYCSQRKLPEATALYKKSIFKAKARPEDFMAYGAALFELHNYTEAQAALQQALSVNDNNVLAHQVLADIYDALHEPIAARRERQRATELGSQKN